MVSVARMVIARVPAASSDARNSEGGTFEFLVVYDGRRNVPNSIEAA